jgi:hypothetical protein
VISPVSATPGEVPAWIKSELLDKPRLSIHCGQPSGRGKDYLLASFVWTPALQSLLHQGIPDNLFEQKKVIFHLERPANTSTK